MMIKQGKFFIVLILFLSISCDTEEIQIIEPIFETSQKDPPTLSYTWLDANIDEEQEDQILDLIEDHGFVWSTFPNNSLDNPNSEIIRKGIKKPNYAFSAFVKNLVGNTTYYVKAFIEMNNQIYYANEISFTTKPGTWKKLSDFPGEGLVNATGFSVDGKGFIVGSRTDFTDAQVWEYDPNLDSWNRKNDAPFSTIGSTSFVINNRGFLYCDLLWEYNSDLDTWSKLNDYPIYTYEHKGCKGVSSFVIGDKAYIGAGVGNLNEGLLEWNSVTNEFTSLTSSFSPRLNPNRSYASMFSLGNKGYVVGGEMWFYEEDESVIEYDIPNLSSSYRGSFDNDRGYDASRKEMVSFVVQGQAFIGMGYGEFPLTYGTNVGSQFDFYRYEPNGNRWIPQTYPVYVDDQDDIHFLDRAGGVSLVIGDRAFMGLGEDREYNRDTESFDTSLYTDFWEFIPN
ncbi:hypothetical protein SanaruYs_37410 [Chryseotalea sanaruensis]|uniref:Galactose oxidase n=1 Tax=Chryseotalea sanaruensis TaxID=2482724 RepID=A0A401UF21_9BACT|nr:hypothetical protein [Chryseotalea sanaruensis]GCC53496.1 hypothetical protein SanaruYs_37410 [Chryseotalea sanaruensis]